MPKLASTWLFLEEEEGQYGWNRKDKVGAKDSSDAGESDHVGLEADGFLLKRMKTHQKFAQGSSMLWFLL